MEHVRRVMAIVGGGLAGACLGGWLSSYLQDQLQILDGQDKFRVGFLPDLHTGGFVGAGLGLGLGVGLLVAALVPDRPK